ncbi:MAG: TonB-dependent receptor plug domain-containing protein, partial [Gammaproteobacteria bacterium]
MKLNNKKLLLPLAISMAIYGPTTLGQESEDDNADDDNVVIVTAQKRSERLTEVPIAMSVFAEDKIDQTGVQELRELGDFIPNMIVTQGTDFNSRILIRGVGAPSRNIGFDSRVGVYLDGVYLGQGPSVNQDLVDLAQVEILRGPQGTLFGKNTVAGAVSMVSKKPDEFFEGKITVGWGNYNARETKANLNLPLADNMYAKIAVSDRVRDGYITNVYQEGTLPTTFNLFTGGYPFFNAPLPA